MNKLNDIMNNKSIFYKVGMFLIILIILMVIPWGLELLIFRNNIYSVIGNEYWSSFLGSYIGGVIGGAGTLFAVLITTKETRVIQKKNEDQMEIDRAEKRKNERKLLVDSVIEDIAKILSNLVTYKDGCVHLQKCEEKIKELNGELEKVRKELIVSRSNKSNPKFAAAIPYQEMAETSCLEAIEAQKKAAEGYVVSRELAIERITVLNIKLQGINEAEELLKNIFEHLRLSQDNNVSFEQHVDEINKTMSIAAEFAEKYVNCKEDSGLHCVN